MKEFFAEETGVMAQRIPAPQLDTIFRLLIDGATLVSVLSVMKSNGETKGKLILEVERG